MANVFRRRGFQAHKEEEQRREKQKERKQGNLWRYFIKPNESEDLPIIFLTEEPILFYEHTLKTPDGKFDNVVCEGEGCEHCETGNRASYKGAWLVVDGREFEIDERDQQGNKTGKKKTISDRIKLYVRGSKDIAKLDRLSRRYGLTTRPYFVSRVGEGTSTSYELDRGDEHEFGENEIRELLKQLPENMQNHYDGTEESLGDIVEYSIFDDVELDGGDSDNTSDEDEGDVDVDNGVQSVDDEEEDKPKKSPTKKKKSPFKFKKK